ncbi:ATP-dependent DNA ligase [Streptomyces sp. NPDC053474]|uniref:ATP-dependent DNA ligase n=1 Tax=Streptomyces sp. NPDC053474 TaxID=3365704 RepID=UPI0037CEF2F8
MALSFPLHVALAQTVTELPDADLAIEWKVDGHRLILAHTEAGPLIQAGRSGRTVTPLFPDLAEVAARLDIGTVLDGEGVVLRAGRLDFSAMQSRALAAPRRAAAMARTLPAHYVAFDVIADGGEDVRGWPYWRRRARLEELVVPLGPPLQVVPMTRDRKQALTWLADEALAAVGLEGLVLKPWSQPYPRGRGWLKLRLSVPRDAVAIGYTGRAQAPVRLVVDLGAEGLGLSTPLTVELRHLLTQALKVSGTGTRKTARLADGSPYWLLDQPLPVEVDHGATRHPATTVRRLRPDLAQ